MKETAEKINAAGGRLYLVGGCVRDKILGVEPKDFDCCVTGLSSDEFLKLFPEAKIRGKDFSVFDLNGCEFALARKERKIKEGHTGFEIETDKKLTIEDDLKRRDITINSIAFDVLDEKIIDPFGGVEDCKKKIIRATSEAFSEDPLRVYRAARFAARLGFEIEESTCQKMNELREELKTLSVERVYEELKKALSTEKPSRFFYELRCADCLDIHFKEISDLIDVEQPVKYHPEGDAFIHTMEVLDRASEKTSDVVIRFAALVHDFGKAKTPKDIWPHHYDHERLGPQCVRDLCRRLKLPTKWKEAGITSCLEHMKAGIFFEMKAATRVDFLERISKTALGLKGLEIIANSDKARENEIQFSKLGEEMLNNINGRTLNVESENYKIIKEKIRSARIAWIKEKMETK